MNIKGFDANASNSAWMHCLKANALQPILQPFPHPSAQGSGPGQKVTCSQTKIDQNCVDFLFEK